MVWSLLLLVISLLMMGYMMVERKRMKGHGAHSNRSQIDWTLHQDYNELKVENERMKKQLLTLSK